MEAKLLNPLLVLCLWRWIDDAGMDPALGDVLLDCATRAVTGVREWY
jgi:hypothetical protein